jgi:hypothetical protein
VCLFLGFAAGFYSRATIFRNRFQNGFNPDRVVSMLQSKLDLDAAQTEKTRAVVMRTGEKMKALREEMRPRMAKIREEAGTEMSEYLNAEQKVKLQERLAEWKKKQESRFGIEETSAKQ